jgi:hypothetical protein
MSGDTTKITLKADGREIPATDVKVEAKQLLSSALQGEFLNDSDPLK